VLWVRRQLLEAPELLATYRQVFGATAEREHASAAAGEDLAEMEAVVRRFALTPTGLKAGLELAGMHLERADPTSAVVVLDQLAAHPDLAPGSDAARRFHLLQA